MAPFYGWGSTASRLEPLRGGSLFETASSVNLWLVYWSLAFGGRINFKKEDFCLEIF